MRLWDAPEELDKRFRDKVKEETAVEDTPEEPPSDVVAPVDIHEWAGRNPVSPEDQDELEDTIERHPAGTQIEEPYQNPGQTIAETATPEFIEEHTVKEPVVEHTIKPIEVKSDGNGREYIDTDDSWVIDLKEALGEHVHRMVEERLAVLRVVGIEYEMRVWRKK